MGRDRMAVVDPQLRVHGLDGLRVADASIMPAIVSANPNAAIIMIGEKAADLMKNASAPPACEPVSAAAPKNWRADHPAVEERISIA